MPKKNSDTMEYFLSSFVHVGAALRLEYSINAQDNFYDISHVSFAGMTNILEEIGPLEENFGVSCSRWSVRCLNIRNLAEFVNLDRFRKTFW